MSKIPTVSVAGLAFEVAANVAAGRHHNYGWNIPAKTPLCQINSQLSVL
jgi:hypothetical protein